MMWLFRIEIFKGEGKHPWYIRLIAENGQTFATSEGYASKWNAKRAANRMFGTTIPINYV